MAAPHTPDLRVITDDDPLQPLAPPDEPHRLQDAPPPADAWTEGEAEFNRDFAGEGAIPVYVPMHQDRLRSQSEMLADASAEGADYIRDMHGRVFAGDIGILERAYAVIGSNSAAVTAMNKSAIDGEFKAIIMMTETAMSSVIQDPMFDQGSKAEVLGAVRAITAMLIKMNDLLLAVNDVRATAAAAVSGMMTSDVEASWRYMPTEGDETANAVQRLYKIAFERAHKLKYARYKDGLMRRIVTSDGFITNAWERVATFQEFVYGLTGDPVGEIHFLATRAVNTMENVAELLSKKREVEVPWLKPDRRVFAFRNGCYMAKDERFITFSRDAPPVMPDGLPCPTACRYHDAPVDLRWIDCPDPRDIPTPLMDHIMDTQQLAPDVKRVYFSMLGRAIYDLGEMDNWQVFLFVKGQAETGKSTLLKFVSSFYSPEDVGILANNIEGTFGASMIAEKFIVVGDDLGENFTLDQQLFQNMSSGNEVSLPRKNKQALITKWITQLLLSGNVLPDYKDNSGSFSRRLLIIYYSKPVRHVDPTIPERLKGEMGAAIIKCNRCYRNMVRRLGYLLTRPERPVTFWDAVPEEFRVQKRNVMQCANAFMSFLNSGVLAYGPSLYITRELFVTQLMNHCQINGIPKPRFQPTQYEGAFAIMGLEMSRGKQKRKYPRTASGKDMTEMWILGCDMATSEAIAGASADSIRAAEAAVQAYAQDPSEASRIAAAAMRQSRKRPAPAAPGQDAPASSAPRGHSDPPPLQRPRLV
jgi:hypothetical protein